MASNDAKIWVAVRNYLETYPGLPSDVVYPGESFNNPDPTVPYLIIDDIRYDPLRRYYTGSNWRTGSLMIMVMLPLEWTYAQRIEYAGKIADHFAQDTVMIYDDLSLRVAQQPTLSGAGYRDGSHFRVPLDVRWEGEVG